MKVPVIEEGSTTEFTSVDVITEVKSHGLWLHAGEKSRKIDKRLAEYFAHHGWVNVVGEAAKPMNPSNVELDVQTGKHASTAENPA